MKTIRAHFDAYEHLKDLPLAGEALQMLRKAALMVKPLMRKRGWKVGALCEFLPPDPRLQGLNINRTQRICVRLRYTQDPRQFIPWENVVDTLLHELSHIVWGPHDGNFQALWDELRTEYQTLRMSGYKGQGFLSKGRVLGARRIHDEELRRQTRVSAVKRTKPSYDGQGRSLDGARLPRGVDMRPVVADAASKSGGITNGCASGTKDGQRLADDAWRNGFRTLAEEDDANEAAIAVALVELYEADRARRLMEETTTSGYHDGLVWSIESGLQPAGGDGANDLPGGSPALGSVAARAPPIEWNDAVWETIYDDVWSCPICTLDNTEQHLACDACGSERPTYISSRKPSTAKIDADSRVSGGEIASSGAHGKLYRWNCQGCGEFMESKRWACSRCGTMNPSS